MTEYKTCEQYVLAELEAAKNELEALRDTNKELRNKVEDSNRYAERNELLAEVGAQHLIDSMSYTIKRVPDGKPFDEWMRYIWEIEKTFNLGEAFETYTDFVATMGEHLYEKYKAYSA